jgi:hypothetical protein
MLCDELRVKDNLLSVILLHYTCKQNNRTMTGGKQTYNLSTAEFCQQNKREANLRLTVRLVLTTGATESVANKF